MKYIVPDYYDDFKCIAEKCKHNCCIGWEIDIDDTTLAYYEGVGGEFGERLKDNISQGQFVLDQNERCPFLNERNLCDIITTLGKQHLCDICHSHPRFHNERDGYVEAGLGLCCEAAARLILTQKHPMHLTENGERAPTDPSLAGRDKLLAALPLPNDCPDITLWAKRLLHFERMDEKWGELLSALPSLTEGDLARFNEYMKDRETEYTRLAAYLIYRHYEKWREEKLGRFVTLVVNLLRHLGALTLRQNGDFTLEDQVELCRLFSCEIEYSDQNLETLFESI